MSLDGSARSDASFKGLCSSDFCGQFPPAVLARNVEFKLILMFFCVVLPPEIEVLSKARGVTALPAQPNDFLAL